MGSRIHNYYRGGTPLFFFLVCFSFQHRTPLNVCSTYLNIMCQHVCVYNMLCTYVFLCNIAIARGVDTSPRTTCLLFRSLDNTSWKYLDRDCGAIMLYSSYPSHANILQKLLLEMCVLN